MVMHRGTATYALDAVAAHMALCRDPEMGSTPECPHRQMIGTTTRQLPCGSDFITYDT